MKKLFIAFILIILSSANAVAEVRKQTFSNGYYIGEVNSKNERHGYGIAYFENGHIQKARWQNNKKVSGSYFWPNGNKFIGKFGYSWYGKFFWTDGSSKFQKNINDNWINSNYSESNNYYNQGRKDSQRANTIVNNFKNKPARKTRYCKNSDGKAYERKSVSSCYSSEKEISYAEYNKIKNTKTRYCKKSDGTVHTRYSVTSCYSYEKELTYSQYNRIKTLIPINETYVVAANYLRVRFEPWESSKRITSLKKGTEVIVIGKVKNRSWYYIKEGFVHSQYLKKKTSFNPAVVVLIVIGVFLFYVIFIKKKDGSSPSWKKYTTESLSRFKPASTKRTTYVSKSSKTATSSRSNKTPFEAKKSRTVGEKATKRIDPIIIKKTKKAIKKGIICKYCDTENRRTAVTCISCNKSLS